MIPAATASREKSQTGRDCPSFPVCDDGGASTAASEALAERLLSVSTASQAELSGGKLVKLQRLRGFARVVRPGLPEHCAVHPRPPYAHHLSDHPPRALPRAQVIAAGPAEEVAKAVAAAEPFKAALLERGVLFVPFATDGGAVPAGATDAAAASSAADGPDKRWRATPVYPGEWTSWFTEQTALAKISAGTPVYVSLRMDGRVRASGAQPSRPHCSFTAQESPCRSPWEHVMWRPLRAQRAQGAGHCRPPALFCALRAALRSTCVLFRSFASARAEE